MNKFEKELETLINQHNQEKGSNTPDYILAYFLQNALLFFDETTRARDAWYGLEQLAPGRVIRDLKEINTKFPEGRLLFSALSILTVENWPDCTPWDALARLEELAGHIFDISPEDSKKNPLSWKASKEKPEQTEGGAYPDPRQSHVIRENAAGGQLHQQQIAANEICMPESHITMRTEDQQSAREAEIRAKFKPGFRYTSAGLPGKIIHVYELEGTNFRAHVCDIDCIEGVKKLTGVTNVEIHYFLTGRNKEVREEPAPVEIKTGLKFTNRDEPGALMEVVSIDNNFPAVDHNLIKYPLKMITRYPGIAKPTREDFYLVEDIKAGFADGRFKEVKSEFPADAPVNFPEPEKEEVSDAYFERYEQKSENGTERPEDTVRRFAQEMEELKNERAGLYKLVTDIKEERDKSWEDMELFKTAAEEARAVADKWKKEAKFQQKRADGYQQDYFKAAELLEESKNSFNNIMYTISRPGEGVKIDLKQIEKHAHYGKYVIENGSGEGFGEIAPLLPPHELLVFSYEKALKTLLTITEEVGEAKEILQKIQAECKRVLALTAEDMEKAKTAISKVLGEKLEPITRLFKTLFPPILGPNEKEALQQKIKELEQELADCDRELKKALRAINENQEMAKGADERFLKAHNLANKNNVRAFRAENAAKKYRHGLTVLQNILSYKDLSSIEKALLQINVSIQEGDQEKRATPPNGEPEKPKKDEWESEDY